MKKIEENVNWKLYIRNEIHAFNNGNIEMYVWWEIERESMLIRIHEDVNWVGGIHFLSHGGGISFEKSKHKIAIVPLHDYDPSPLGI